MIECFRPMRDEIRITIYDLPPMPRNRSHRVTRNMLIKTDLARAFEADLTERMGRIKNDTDAFAGLVRESHYLSAVYTIHTPRGLLLTKEGRVSARSVDWDAHKLFQDVLFKCMGLDDKLVRDGRVITPVSPDDNWHYEIKFKLENLTPCLTTPTLTLTSSTTELPKDNSTLSAHHLL